MRKIAINTNYGGFSITQDAIRLGRQLSGNPMWGGPSLLGDVWDDDGSPVEKNGLFDDLCFVSEVTRDDPILIEVIERMGAAASVRGTVAIVEIPSDVDWEIVDYDGWEHVAEKHRTWGLVKSESEFGPRFLPVPPTEACRHHA